MSPFFFFATNSPTLEALLFAMLAGDHLMDPFNITTVHSKHDRQRLTKSNLPISMLISTNKGLLPHNYLSWGIFVRNGSLLGFFSAETYSLKTGKRY